MGACSEHECRGMLWRSCSLPSSQMLRLINLLSAYAVHDPETGYCQVDMVGQDRAGPVWEQSS